MLIKLAQSGESSEYYVFIGTFKAADLQNILEIISYKYFKI